VFFDVIQAYGGLIGTGKEVGGKTAGDWLGSTLAGRAVCHYDYGKWEIA